MEKGVLHGVRVYRRAPVVSKFFLFFFFKDDILIFRRATMEKG